MQRGTALIRRERLRAPSLVIRVAAILDEFDITYALGVSMASSFFGEPRATADIDVAVDLDAGSGDRLVDRLQSEFYVPTASARAAVRAQSRSTSSLSNRG